MNYKKILVLMSILLIIAVFFANHLSENKSKTSTLEDKGDPLQKSKIIEPALDYGNYNELDQEVIRALEGTEIYSTFYFVSNQNDACIIVLDTPFGSKQGTIDVLNHDSNALVKTLVDSSIEIKKIIIDAGIIIDGCDHGDEQCSGNTFIKFFSKEFQNSNGKYEEVRYFFEERYFEGE